MVLFKNGSCFQAVLLLAFLVGCGGGSGGIKDVSGAGSKTGAEPGPNSGSSGGDDPSDVNDDDESEATTATYYGAAKALLDSYCAPCHGVPPSGGATDAFSLAIYDDIGTVKGAFSMASKSKERLQDGSMPPSGFDPAMSDEDKAILVSWIDDGALRGDPPAPEKESVPTLEFISPGAAGAVADATYDVKVKLGNFPAGATWALYYGTTPKVTTGGQLIVDKLPGTNSAYTWDTSGIAIGTYYLYAVITNGDFQFRFAGAGKVDISHLPTVGLTSHQGGTVYKNGTGAGSIEWTMNNAEGRKYHYKLEYSADGGGTYQPIPGAEDLDDVFTFSGWDISNTTTYPIGARYKVRVQAIDVSGATPEVVAESSSPATFGISDHSLTYYGDVYPIFTQRTCTNCHSNGKTNANANGLKAVEAFAVDEATFPGIGAFEMQNRLVADAVLGANGSMRAKAPAFTDDDFDMVKLWKWDGAASGTGLYTGLRLTSHKGATVILKSASPTLITWSHPNKVLNGQTTDHYDVEITRDGNVVATATTSPNANQHSFDISGFAVDHRYRVKITGRTAAPGNLLTVTAESTAEFSISDKLYIYSTDVVPALTALGCGGCHNANNASGGYNIQLASTLSNQANLAIRTKPMTGNMPAAGGLMPNDWMPIRIWDTGGRQNLVFAVTAPAADQYYDYGNINLTWSATGGSTAGIKYDLAYEKRGGASTPLATDVATTNYTWNTAGFVNTDEGYYRVTITAKDATNAEIADFVTPEFYLSPNGPTYTYGVQPLLLSLGCGGCHGASGGYTVTDRTTLDGVDMKLYNKVGPGGNMPMMGGIGAADFKLIQAWKDVGDFVP